jgi:hypothetical protein
MSRMWLPAALVAALLAMLAPGPVAGMKSVNKIEALVVKQKSVRFNPKELTIDKSVPWQKHKRAGARARHLAP